MTEDMVVQVYQRARLYDLLKIKAANKGIKINELDALINALEAEMMEEDVAYVEKNIAEYIDLVKF